MEALGHLVDEPGASLRLPGRSARRHQPDDALGEAAAVDGEGRSQGVAAAGGRGLHLHPQRLAQVLDGAKVQGADQTLATLEVMQDRRMRYARGLGHFLQAKAPWPGPRHHLFGSVENDAAGLVRRPADALGRSHDQHS